MEQSQGGPLRSSEHSPISAALGQVIHTRRKSTGLSLEQAALRADISRTMLSYVERGLRKPTVDLIDRIAQALDTSVDLVISEAHQRRSL